MKKVVIITIFLVAVAVVFFVSRKMAPAPSNNSVSDIIQSPVVENTLTPNVSVPVIPSQNNSSGLVAPLERAGERVTKKPFGIFITPQNSPVQPERFRGYHTGIDFEVFPKELNADVPVKTVCGGKMKIKEYASGYGGVMVEDCTIILRSSNLF